MSTSAPQRIGALIFAALFLLSSVAVTALIVFQANQSDNSQLPPEVAQQLKQQQQAQEGQLQGTKLENFSPVEKVEALQKIDITEGTGEEVKPGAKVVAHYTGALAKDGTIFQSSYDRGEPVPFGLNEVIKGWTDGVPGMKVGGKRRILIPADQAYGPSEREGIPANSDLVFDIELVSIQE